MTPREIVLRALSHTDGPIPFSWGLGVTSEMTAEMEAACVPRGYTFAALRQATEHIRTITPRYTGPSLPDNRDVWGIGRTRVAHEGGAYDEITYHPLAEAQTPSDLEAFAWPDHRPYAFDGLAQELKLTDPDHAFAHRLWISASGNPLEIYTWMTGLEQMLVNLLLRPELVIAALDRITSHFEQMMRCAARAVRDWIDIVYLADDLGGQHSLLFSRDTYVDLIQPFHRRLAGLAAEILPEAQVMYHTDGAVFPVLPDLVDAGVQILEAVQTDADGMDPVQLKRHFGSELSFHGGIPVQSLLPHGTRYEVAAGVIELCGVFGDSGGYIAAPSHAVQLGTPPENVFTMLESALGWERFHRAEIAARGLTGNEFTTREVWYET